MNTKFLTLKTLSSRKLSAHISKRSHIIIRFIFQWFKALALEKVDLFLKQGNVV